MSHDPQLIYTDATSSRSSHGRPSLLRKCRVHGTWMTSFSPQNSTRHCHPNLHPQPHQSPLRDILAGRPPNTTLGPRTEYLALNHFSQPHHAVVSHHKHNNSQNSLLFDSRFRRKRVPPKVAEILERARLKKSAMRSIGRRNPVIRDSLIPEQGKQEIVTEETHGPNLNKFSLSPSPLPDNRYARDGMSRNEWMTGAAYVWEVLDSAGRALEAMDGGRED